MHKRALVRCTEHARACKVDNFIIDSPDASTNLSRIYTFCWIHRRYEKEQVNKINAILALGVNNQRLSMINHRRQGKLFMFESYIV